MEFHLNCRLGYEVVGSASFLFNVAAVRNSLQRVATEDVQVAGAESFEELLVGGRRFHRVVAQTGRLELRYDAVAGVNAEILQPESLNISLLRDLPAEVLVFLYPSRFCQSDLLARFARREFNVVESGFERVTRICNWIYEFVEYLPGFTNSSTSAFDTATQRAGVCRVSPIWVSPFAGR
jgi:transglutaminase-like putative cysteine protease